MLKRTLSLIEAQRYDFVFIIYIASCHLQVEKYTEWRATALKIAGKM